MQKEDSYCTFISTRLFCDFSWYPLEKQDILHSVAQTFPRVRFSCPFPFISLMSIILIMSILSLELCCIFSYLLLSSMLIKECCSVIWIQQEFYNEYSSKNNARHALTLYVLDFINFPYLGNRQSAQQTSTWVTRCPIGFDKSKVTIKPTRIIEHQLFNFAPALFINSINMINSVFVETL